jgi:hypothetical protein
MQVTRVHPTLKGGQQLSSVSYRGQCLHEAGHWFDFSPLFIYLFSCFIYINRDSARFISELGL